MIASPRTPSPKRQALIPDHDPLVEQIERALALRASGRPEEAVQLLTAIRAQWPPHPSVLNLLGVLYFENDQAERSLEPFRAALKIDRRSNPLHYHLGQALLDLGLLHEAHTHLRRAVQIQPGEPLAGALLARTAEMLGRVDEARRNLRALLKQHPDHPAVVFGYGEFCLRRGDYRGAKRMFDHAVKRGIEPAAALKHLAEIPAADIPPPDPDEIARRLSKSDLSEPDRIALSYAAGKIALRQKRAGDAIRYFLEAKAPIVGRTNPDRHDARYQGLIDQFTPTFFAERPDFGIDSRVPVFVLGMPRSGTTLCEQILASHPHVATARESRAMRLQADRLDFGALDQRQFFNRIRDLSSSDARGLANDYLAFLRGQVPQPRPRIVDKMPHNFEMLGLIALLLPKATVIHCVRNPLDTCISCVLTEFFGTRLSFTGDLALLGRYYRDYVRLMQHWETVLPIPIHHVRYEALVLDAETEARKMVESAGIDWDPACLRFYESDRLVTTASHLQVKNPIYTSSIGRWRDYEPYIHPLIEALGDLARPEAQYATSGELTAD